MHRNENRAARFRTGIARHLPHKDLPMRRKRALQKTATMAYTAGRSAIATAELSAAAGQVIARRMALGVSALADPLGADHAEFGRMVPEKVDALTSASTAMAKVSLAMVGETARRSADDAMQASRAMVDLALCRSPAAFMAIQNRLAQSWLTQSYAQSIALWATGLRFHEAAMAPYHRAATRNARRLSK